MQPVLGNAESSALAAAIAASKEVQRLRLRLAAADRELAKAEQRIPERYRDFETVELHLAGCTTGSTKLFMEQLFMSKVYDEYLRVLSRKAMLERLLLSLTRSAVRQYAEAEQAN